MAADLSLPFAADHDGGGEAMSVLESLLLEEDVQTMETDDPTLWEKMAAVNPRRTPRELEEKFHAVLAENSAAILGLQHLPADHLRYHPQPRFQLPMAAAPPASAMLVSLEPSLSRLVASLKQALPDRSTTKGVTWSDEEHRLFLLGMDLHGKGDWKSISRYFVVSRTPSQIASHAQKFFNRKMSSSDRRRASIHDVCSTAHLQNPFGSFQNMFTDGRLSYLGQLQMTLLAGNRHMPPPPSAAQHFGFNVS